MTIKTKLASDVLTRTEENGKKLNMYMASVAMKLVNNMMEEELSNRTKANEIFARRDKGTADDAMFLIKVLQHQRELNKTIDEKTKLIEKLRDIDGITTYDTYANHTRVEVDGSGQFAELNPVEALTELMRGVEIANALEKIKSREDDSLDISDLDPSSDLLN